MTSKYDWLTKEVVQLKQTQGHLIEEIQDLKALVVSQSSVISELKDAMIVLTSKLHGKKI